MRFLLRLAVSAAALAVATAVLPGIQLTAGSTISKVLTLVALATLIGLPGRFAIMGSLPLDKPDETRVRLTSWRHQPGMLGLRWSFLHDPVRRWFVDTTLDWLWTAAEKAEVPVAMLCTDSLANVRRIAERHPGLRLTVDQLGGRGGFETRKDAAAMTHIPDLVKLAKHPNIAVKATGAPGYASGSYPYASMHTYLRQIFDAFGPERVFWGTDISKMHCSWKQCVTMFTEEPSWLRGRDLELVIGDGLCAWWGWERRPNT